MTSQTPTPHFSVETNPPKVLAHLPPKNGSNGKEIVELHPLWLRERCQDPTNLDPLTQQRTYDHTNSPKTSSSPKLEANPTKPSSSPSYQGTYNTIEFRLRRQRRLPNTTIMGLLPRPQTHRLVEHPRRRTHARSPRKLSHLRLSHRQTIPRPKRTRCPPKMAATEKCGVGVWLVMAILRRFECVGGVGVFLAQTTERGSLVGINTGKMVFRIRFELR